MQSVQILPTIKATPPRSKVLTTKAKFVAGEIVAVFTEKVSPMKEKNFERWPITDSDKVAIVARLIEILQGQDVSKAVASARVLLAMDKQNFRVEQMQEKLSREIHEQIRSEAMRILQSRS